MKLWQDWFQYKALSHWSYRPTQALFVYSRRPKSLNVPLQKAPRGKESLASSSKEKKNINRVIPSPKSLANFTSKIIFVIRIFWKYNWHKSKRHEPIKKLNAAFPSYATDRPVDRTHEQQMILYDFFIFFFTNLIFFYVVPALIELQAKRHEPRRWPYQIFRGTFNIAPKLSIWPFRSG